MVATAYLFNELEAYPEDGILGFDETLKNESHNFVEADAAEASKNGTLAELVNRSFD